MTDNEKPAAIRRDREQELVDNYRRQIEANKQRGMCWSSPQPGVWMLGPYTIVATVRSRADGRPGFAKTIVTGEDWVFATDRSIGFVGNRRRGSIGYQMEKFGVRPTAWDRDAAVEECREQADEARQDGNDRLADAWTALGEELGGNDDLNEPISVAIAIRDGDFDPITFDGEWHVPGTRAPSSFPEAIALMDTFADDTDDRDKVPLSSREIITNDRNGKPVYRDTWLRFDASEFGGETPPFQLLPTWEPPFGTLADISQHCDVVDSPGEVLWPQKFDPESRPNSRPGFLPGSRADFYNTTLGVPYREPDAAATEVPQAPPAEASPPAAPALGSDDWRQMTTQQRIEWVFANLRPVFRPDRIVFGSEAAPADASQPAPPVDGWLVPVFLRPDSDWDVVQFWYINHRGGLSWRRVRPKSLRFGASAFYPHESPGWMMEGHDLDKGADRLFRLDRIQAAADLIRSGSTTQVPL